MPRKTVNQFLVRLPPELDAWVEKAAAENCRSKNSEILFRLKAAMAAENKPPASADGATAAGRALSA